MPMSFPSSVPSGSGLRQGDEPLFSPGAVNEESAANSVSNPPSLREPLFDGTGWYASADMPPLSHADADA